MGELSIAKFDYRRVISKKQCVFLKQNMIINSSIFKYDSQYITNSSNITQFRDTILLPICVILPI